MPWLSRKVDVTRHACKKPRIGRVSIGSSWQCGECGDVWVIISGMDDFREKMWKLDG